MKKFLVIICFSVFLSVFAFGQNTKFVWQYDQPENHGFSSDKLDVLVDSLAQKGTKKLLIIRNDRIICEYFSAGFNDDERQHYTASLAKALVSGLSLALAMDDGLISPDEPVCNYIPQWQNDSRKSKITVRHLATHTSGIEDAEVSAEEQIRMREKGLHTHKDLPGWKGHFWRQDKNPFEMARDSADVLFVPGTQFHYSNPGIGLLNYAVTAALKETKYTDIKAYLSERIFGQIGIDKKEYSIGYNKSFQTDGLQIVPGWGGGSFTAGAVARLGRLMLNKGKWEGKQIISSEIIEEVLRYNGTDLPNLENERSKHWAVSKDGISPNLGWYCNHDGIWKYLPRDAFAGAGAQNQMLMVIPGLDMIIVRFGAALSDETTDETFFEVAEKYIYNPIMEALEEPPYPPSNLFTDVEFAPVDSVVRMAEGSDNWPAAWADDDNLYTAYGDGWGFKPHTEIKLSLGLAKVEGNPSNLKGTNIRSASGERVGQGKYGPKASGMLMVDGVLYMIARNTGNAQLGWSEDYGKTWEWANWRFGEGFGCPVFLDCGKNYRDAQDDFVYVYSQDEESAYKLSDHMILARIPKSKIKNREDYMFFAGLEAGKAIWTEDVQKRKPVFVNPARCYRSAVSYNKALHRYLWCQIIPVYSGEELQGPRFKGGLGIFESENPWGPWSTVYYTNDWDIGPGETGSIPTKWISEDGRSCYYLFSGNDCFSLRKLFFSLK